LLGLYGVWRCHDEAIPLLPVGLDTFCKLHLKATTELHGTMQNSDFHHTSENGLTVLPWNPKNTVSINFPADGITLNSLIEGDLGCFHCIEAYFDLGW
jgi:hypothetical protein